MVTPDGTTSEEMIVKCRCIEFHKRIGPKRKRSSRGRLQVLLKSSVRKKAKPLTVTR